MAEQFCTRLLDFLVQLVQHRRSSFLAFCVLNRCIFCRGDSWKSFSHSRLNESLNDTSYCEKAVPKSGFLWSCSWTVFAAYDRYYQRLDIEDELRRHQVETTQPSSVQQFWVWKLTLYMFSPLHLFWMLLWSHLIDFSLFRSICDIRSL